jgi:predicted MFS family arabinose efflux permease
MAHHQSTAARDSSPRANVNLMVIGVTALLTLVDLFATQAILPALAASYQVTPAAMSVAVNACTIGMAIAGVLAAMVSGRVDRRNVIVGSLFVLAIPTALLAHAPDLTTFTILRIIQGLLMCTAFTLTLAHLGERCSVSASPAAFAAYVTGNVASNLVGRLVSATTVGTAGLHANFYLFGILNILGAMFVWATLSRSAPRAFTGEFKPWLGLIAHLRTPQLLASFGIGFCILFAFLGIFTYVNFVLVKPPLALAMGALGLIYFVFAPSIFTTLQAGNFVARFGARKAIWLGLAVALISLPLLASHTLALVILGMTLAGMGTYFAQAAATGFVSRTATRDKGAASGLYLAFYFSGGLVGTAALGVAFEKAGWIGVLWGVAAALAVAGALTFVLPSPRTASNQ